VERLVEVRDLDDVISAELLLGLGVWPVLHLSFPVALTDRRASMPRLERSAPHHDPGLGERLGIGPIGAPVCGLARLVGAVAEVGRALVDQDRVLHGDSPPVSWSRWRLPLLDPMTSDRAVFRRCRRPLSAGG